MNVLDELRNKLVRLSDLAAYDEGYRGFTDGVRAAISRLDAFAAEHPGLIDRTIRCTECGAPGPELPPKGWTGVWVPDDGEHFRCPDCSEKEEK